RSLETTAVNTNKESLASTPPTSSPVMSEAQLAAFLKRASQRQAPRPLARHAPPPPPLSGKQLPTPPGTPKPLPAAPAVMSHTMPAPLRAKPSPPLKTNRARSLENEEDVKAPKA